jgi:hypothetical protein
MPQWGSVGEGLPRRASISFSYALCATPDLVVCAWYPAKDNVLHAAYTRQRTSSSVQNALLRAKPCRVYQCNARYKRQGKRCSMLRAIHNASM